MSTEARFLEQGGDLTWANTVDRASTGAVAAGEMQEREERKVLKDEV